MSCSCFCLATAVDVTMVRIFILSLILSMTQLQPAIAKFTFDLPDHGYNFTAGQPTTLQWKPQSNVIITLDLVSASHSEIHQRITTNITNIGAYTWTVPTDLPSLPDYEISIYDMSNVNDYTLSPTFSINGLKEAAIPTSTATAHEPTTIPPSSSSSSATTATHSSSTNSQSVLSGQTPAPQSTSMSLSSSTPPSSSSSLPPWVQPPPTSDSRDATTSRNISPAKIKAIVIPIVVTAFLSMLALFLRYYFLRRNSHNPNGNVPDSSFPSEVGPDNTVSRWITNPSGVSSKLMQHLGLLRFLYRRPPRSATTVPTMSSPKGTIENTNGTHIYESDSGLWHMKAELPGSGPEEGQQSRVIERVELPV